MRVNDHKDNLDTLFKRMASSYADMQGEELKKEFEMLEQNSPPTITPELDAKVKGKLRKKNRSYGRIWGILAACLLIAVMIPVISTQINGQLGVTQSSIVGEQQEAASGESNTAEEGVIPLSFTLPENFSVLEVEQDVGKTIYYLQDMRLDNVVLTLQRSDGFIVPDGLNEYEINGETVHGIYKTDFSFLTFEKDGIVYEMTSEHDIDTLLELGTAII